MTIVATPHGPAVETLVTKGSARFICRDYPLHVASVRAHRSAAAFGEAIAKLPWFRSRDNRGRFSRRVGA